MNTFKITLEDFYYAIGNSGFQMIDVVLFARAAKKNRFLANVVREDYPWFTSRDIQEKFDKSYYTWLKDDADNIILSDLRREYVSSVLAATSIKEDEVIEIPVKNIEQEASD